MCFLRTSGMYQKLLLRCLFCWNFRSRESWLRARAPLPQWQQPIILPAIHRGNEIDIVMLLSHKCGEWGMTDGKEIDFFGWLEKNNFIRKSMCSLKGWCKWFRERKRNTELLGGKKKHSDGDLVTALLGDRSPPSLLWWVANARNMKQRVQSITRASEVSGGHALDYYR